MELSVDLAGSLDFITGKVGDIDSALKKKPLLPFFDSRPSQGTLDNNSSAVIICGTPNTGRIWNVTGITLVGADDHTTLANAKAALYFGDPQNVGLAQCKVPALTVPSFQTFSERVLWCHSTENVFIAISGTATAGSSVLATVHYADWPEDAVAGNSGK